MSEATLEYELDENSTSQSTDSDENLEKFLTFISDELIYGVSTDYVIEIITNYSITRLPVVPDYVMGIINLRGQIIPIIDIRTRMYKMPMESDTSCIIVLEIDGVSVGIMVDSVSQVLDIDKTQIAPMPINNNQELVKGMCSLPSGVILFLDCPLLIQG